MRGRARGGRRALPPHQPSVPGGEVPHSGDALRALGGVGEGAPGFLGSEAWELGVCLPISRFAVVPRWPFPMIFFAALRTCCSFKKKFLYFSELQR